MLADLAFDLLAGDGGHERPVHRPYHRVDVVERPKLVVSVPQIHRELAGPKEVLDPAVELGLLHGSGDEFVDTLLNDGVDLRPDLGADLPEVLLGDDE